MAGYCAMLKDVRSIYASQPTEDFSSAKLIGFQKYLVSRVGTRAYCNVQTTRIKPVLSLQHQGSYSGDGAPGTADRLRSRQGKVRR